jgi:DNA-binding transcriptional LysR family regulator
VSIGCTPSSGERLLPPLLHAFHARFPAIAVSITIAPQETLLEWLTMQQVHVLLIEEQQRRRGWEAQMLGAERLLLVAPRGHALLQQEQVPPGTLRGQISGRVILGCTPSSGERLLPPLLNAFHMRFPAIAVTITIAPLETLLEWLTMQQVHVLLIEEPQRRRGWESQVLGAERLLLMAPRGHALLQQEQVPPGTLRGQPLILPRAGTPLRRAIEDGLRRRGVAAADIATAIETDSVTLMIQAVRDGMGLAFVPQTRLPRGRDIGLVDLAGVNLQQEWHFLRSRERGAARAIQELYSFVVGKDARRILAKEGLKIAND